MDLQLSGKTALVSASTAGIGFAIAKRLALEGARVVVNGRTPARVQHAVGSIRDASPGAQLVELAADLSTAGGIEQAARRVPHVDVLVNNLGEYWPRPFEQLSAEDWRQIIEFNFVSGALLTRAYLLGMRERNWGRVIFIASESGVNIPGEMIHYGVTKAMQIALARGLANTLKGTGITVNSLLPGPTWTEGVERFVTDVARERGVAAKVIEQEFFAQVRPTSLLQRFATADEVAAFAAYIASPLSAATNGAALRVEGGIVNSML